MQHKPIAEQVVVLFGASSGIGRAAAQRFAALGARVVVAARGEEGLDSLVNEIQAAGGTAVAVPAEVTDLEQVKHVAAQAVAHYGQLDTWVHLAGVSVYGNFWELQPEDFKRVVEVNLVGQAYGAMAAIPHMRDQGGALIHVSSMIGQRAMPLQSAYSAAKYGVNGLTEALRIELRHAKIPITVTTILPWAINTPFFDNAKSRMGVRPMAPPPVYDPALVADAIIGAAERPQRDVIVGRAGVALSLFQRLSPRLVDAVLLRTAFTLQKSAFAESPSGPHNLYAPLAGHGEVEGNQIELIKSSNLVGRFLNNRHTKRFFAGVATLSTALLVGRALGKRQAQPALTAD